MSADNTTGLDKAAQEAIGNKLAGMYHSSTAIHDLSLDLLESTSIRSQHLLRAIRDMAKAQARDLDYLAEKLTGEHTGFYEAYFNEL